MAEYYHLAIAWDWEYDKTFVAMLEARVQASRLYTYSISHHNVDDTLRALQAGTLRFGAFLDRAGDGDEKFPPLAEYIKKTDTLFLNHPDQIHHAADKATMHLEFMQRGIEVPFSVIISPYNKKKEVELRLSDIARLKWPFIIKPANTTGGGIGVVVNAATLKDVINARQHHKNDKYLLQEKIIAARLGEKKGWFRVFCVFGSIIPCWWDDETHLYDIITQQEMKRYHLHPLLAVTRKIHEVCRLDFFSTEIALAEDGRVVAVDYVNDICDMRLQSEHRDGVPDTVVQEICRIIAKHLRTAFKTRG